MMYYLLFVVIIKKMGAMRRIARDTWPLAREPSGLRPAGPDDGVTGDDTTDHAVADPGALVDDLSPHQPHRCVDHPRPGGTVVRCAVDVVVPARRVAGVLLDGPQLHGDVPHEPAAGVLDVPPPVGLAGGRPAELQARAGHIDPAHRGGAA